MPAVETRESKKFASATELKTSYAASRARLMGKSSQPQQVVQPEALPEPPPAPEPPPPAPEPPPPVAQAEPEIAQAVIIHDDIRDVVAAVAAVMSIAPSAVLADLSASATKARRVAIAIARRRGVSFVTRRFGVGSAIVHDAMRTLDAILLQKSISARFAPLDELAAMVVREWDDFDRAASRNVPIGEIKRVVADVFGVTVSDIDSVKRSVPVTQARHVAMGLVRHLTLRSMPEIARQFGYRDHTTVLHAVRKYQALIDRVAATMSDDAGVRDWAVALRREIGPWQGEP